MIYADDIPIKTKKGAFLVVTTDNSGNAPKRNDRKLRM